MLRRLYRFLDSKGFGLGRIYYWTGTCSKEWRASRSFQLKSRVILPVTTESKEIDGIRGDCEHARYGCPRRKMRGSGGSGGGGGGGGGGGSGGSGGSGVEGEPAASETPTREVGADASMDREQCNKR